jgi:hypothetical protein
MPPDELFEALRSACKGEHWDLFADLCNRHAQLILDCFATWRGTLPALDDRTALNDHAHTFVTIATAFKNAGRPELWEQLTGNEHSNPILLWQSDYERAESLVQQDECGSAIALLTRCLEAYCAAVGSAADHFLPRTHGLLGVAYFNTGDLGKAREHTEAALSACRRLEDVEGMETYSRTLQALAAIQDTLDSSSA